MIYDQKIKESNHEVTVFVIKILKQGTEKQTFFFFPESIYVMNVVTVKYFKRQFQQLQGITCKEITRFVNVANC